MKLAYICNVNPFRDRKSWSGTYYNTRKALELAGNTIDWISYDASSKSFRIRAKASKILSGGGIVLSRSIGKIKVKTIERDLSIYDAVFVPGQSDIVSELETTSPIIHYSDATVALMEDYYYNTVSKKGLIKADEVEKRTIDKSAINLYASDWACESALKDYQADKRKTFVVPFGPGIEATDVNHISDNGYINILFSGVDWERKGGLIAVETVKSLNEKGLNCQLTICGPHNLSEELLTCPYIKYLGFLDKNNTVDLERYIEAWKRADLFILPTRAECAGIVFSEAAEFGVPVLTTDTGGISTYVINDFNGKRLALDASATDYANTIIQWVNEKKLTKYSTNAKKMYDEKLSWAAWAKQFNTIANNLIDHQ